MSTRPCSKASNCCAVPCCGVSLQAITMGMMLAAEPAEPDIMERPPRRPGKRLLGKLILWRCAFVSGLLVILVLGMYGEWVLWAGPGAGAMLAGP